MCVDPHRAGGCAKRPVILAQTQNAEMVGELLAPIAGRAGVGALLHGAPTAGNAKGASVGALLHGAQSAGVGLLCVQPWVSKKSCQSASERFGWGLCFSLM